MSESPSPNQSPPPSSGQRYRTATEIIHSILDDRLPAAAISPSGELYRAVERFHRNVREIRREATAAQDRGSSSSSSMSGAGSERDLRRRFNRDPLPPGSSQEDDVRRAPASTSNTSLPPLRSLNLRRGSRATARDRVLSAHQYALQSSRGSSGTFEDLDRLADANSHLRALLDHNNANPIVPPRAMSPPPQPSEPNDESRRVKRRRLDSDKTAQIYRGFRYGKHGQSEPGQLTMELVSCDGGLFMNGYAAENILKNDASVYCTKGSRCNIVLRHQGSTVFSLKQLTIKAPDSNFTSPVREGMVFMSMESDDLFTRTAQYQIQYRTPRVERENRPAVYSVRHDGDGSHITRLPPMWANSREAGFDFDRFNFEGDDDDVDQERVALLPVEFIGERPTYNVTAECSNDDDDAEPGGRLSHSRSYARLQVPRIGALPFESDTSEDDGDNWAPSGWATFDELARGHYDRRRPAGTRSGEREASLTRSLAEAREASQVATQEAVRAVGGELMTPMVHFHINKHKNNCTINFDPPVSGRFILLKMWSPHHDPSANIDIQGVIAKGFAGPRLVPSVEYR